MEQDDDGSSYPPESYIYGLYGAVGTLSRIGDEHQIEIPSLLTNYELHDYIKNPIKEEKKKEILPSDFLIGLEIPVVWISQKKKDSVSDLTPKLKNESVLVPGCVLEPWSKMEKGSFVLGLYIFGKDFVLLKRFMESKKVGEIMSFYYGSFYKSDEYKKWSECRKGRGRKCIMGQRIFCELGQQEFLCRLFPRISEECQKQLLEVFLKAVYLLSDRGMTVYDIGDILPYEIFTKEKVKEVVNDIGAKSSELTVVMNEGS